jgi:hypothetical protein
LRELLLEHGDATHQVRIASAAAHELAEIDACGPRAPTASASAAATTATACCAAATAAEACGLHLLHRGFNLCGDRVPQITEALVPGHGTDQIVAGLQAVNAIDAAIVSLRLSGLLQSFFSGAHHVAHHAHLSSGSRLAAVVHDDAGDDAALRQRDVCALHFLRGRQLDWRTGAARPLGAVGHIDVTGLRRRHREAPGRERRER